MVRALTVIAVKLARMTATVCSGLAPAVQVSWRFSGRIEKIQNFFRQ